MTKTICDLNSTEFENLVFDLTQSIGLKNVVWRTPGRDGGRDIQGEWYIKDLSGYESSQVWYIECKRYETSVGWPTVWEKISFAESNSADVLLFAVTSSLSPQAIDEVNKWNAKRKVPIIRFWNGFDIENKLRLFPIIAVKFGLTPDSRIEIGGALLPVVNILLKFSIAAHSAYVFEAESTGKHCVLYSLSELISARLSDIESEGVFSTASFRNSKDGFEWLINSEILEIMKVDRYAIRALTSYLKDFLKVQTVCLSEEDESVAFELSVELPDSVFNDLYQISLLSNFEIYNEENRLKLKVR